MVSQEPFAKYFQHILHRGDTVLSVFTFQYNDDTRDTDSRLTLECNDDADDSVGGLTFEYTDNRGVTVSDFTLEFNENTRDAEKACSPRGLGGICGSTIPASAPHMCYQHPPPLLRSFIL